MTDHDFKLSEEMVTYWTNFMKTGNPNGETKNQEEKNTWENYTKAHPYVSDKNDVKTVVKSLILC